MSDKATFYAKKLTQNIENGTIKRKVSSSPSSKADYVHNPAYEELSLYKYKKYLGSLRCMLDMKNMRKAYTKSEV